MAYPPIVRRLLACLVVVVAAMLPGASPGAGGTDWQHLKYMLYEIQDELITTDGSWENARVVTPI